MVDVKGFLTAAIYQVSDEFKKRIQEELQKQGFGQIGSSRIIDNIKYTVHLSGNDMVTIFEMEDYWWILERGLKPTEIPYTPGSGAGTSKFIKALQEFAVRKIGGLDSKQSLRTAFAMATSLKETGMPSPNSVSKFSPIHKRTGALDTVFNKGDWISAFMEGILFKNFELVVDEFVDETNKLIKLS